MKTQAMNLNQLLDIDDAGLQGSGKGEGVDSKCSVKLEERELWAKFKEYTNEMIVTKNGRRMFPVFKASLNGLDPNSMYTILLDFVQVEGHRWKYVNGEWVAGGKAEPSVPNCVYVHPDSPNFGSHWMKEPISFSKVKLTNKMNGGGQIMLNSLHKYEPRLHVVKITALKIKHNPFAKAFLDAKERPDQRDLLDDNLDNQRSLSHLTGTWYLPPGGGLVPPPAHQFPNALNLSAPAHCDRLSFRNSRHNPYSHPYQRRSPPGGISREMAQNLPCLNIADNWPQFSTSPSMLSGNSVGTQSQYGMWMPGSTMPGNISPNQNCSMPYLRNTGYPIPSTSSPTHTSSGSGLMFSSNSFEQCDISNFIPTPSRDISRNSNWSPLTPPPI
ncbi:TBXT1-like protein [Mya arenaria]|uniref:T-box transcription factor T n=1 Tax=Mya arenaria TaxID=6604 RepID=A0ABY7EG05_MYAAR|nr:TBXT1-like protein [Mya arenaria]